MTPPPAPGRRRLLRATPALLAMPALLAGCAAPLPPLDAERSAPEALALLDRAAAAQGADAFGRLGDLAAAFDGEWPPIIGRLQPALVDQGHRGGSEERWLLRDGVLAQRHRGPDGEKRVLRRWDADREAVRVWFDSGEALDAERRAAAALVADGYALFLCGPMLLRGRWWRDRAPLLQRDPPERITLHDGTAHDCDVLRVRITPGLGWAESDRLALLIDREHGLMRRVRFTLDGLPSTRGAVAEVDCMDHRALGGVLWPSRFRERLLRPLPLPVHDWRLTGLDLDRGLAPADLLGADWSARAARPAARLETAGAGGV